MFIGALSHVPAVSGNRERTTCSAKKERNGFIGTLVRCVLVPTSVAVLTTGIAHGQISFQNVTNSSLDTLRSETWGASIGDYNGDLWPDIFVGNHRERSSLYRNNGDSTYTNVMLQVDRGGVWLNNRFHDHHGAAFADYNGDGYDDLAVSTNAASNAIIAVSNGLYLDNRASQLGLQEDGSGWSVSWFDYNRDGRTDVARMSYDTSDLRRQVSTSSFTSGASISNCRNNNYVQFADVDADGSLDMLCGKEGQFPSAIYDVSNGFPQARSIPTGLAASAALDSVIADFDGDLENEIVVVRGAIFPNQAKSISPNRAEAFLDSASGQGNAGYTFQSSSSVTFTVHGRGVTPTPIAVSRGSSRTIFAGGRAEAANLFVSSTGSGNWTVQLRSGEWAAAYVEMDSNGTMSNFTETGLRPEDGLVRPKAIDRTGSTWTDKSWEFGFRTGVSCAGITSGDYDNDGDIDIAMSCRGGVENLANRIYENDGNGFFTRLANAGGAEGIVGAGLGSRAGTSENILTTDFNNDGFLDLFVTNGMNDEPIRFGGPHELIRNLGNSNNWILLKLQGTQSNPAGIGARVLATANGKTQVREQNGGYHRWSQDDQRIHFGLANNNSVNLTIEWPSGVVDTFNNVSANQIYRATEAGSITPVTPGTPQQFPTPRSADTCGAPRYIAQIDRGLFVYRSSCSSNRWIVRAVGGQPGGSFIGRITQTNGGNFSNLSRTGLESGDSVIQNGSSIDYSMLVTTFGVEGFEFNLSGGGCLVLDSPSNARVMVGGRHLPVPSQGFDLGSLNSCSAGSLPQISIAAQSFQESVGVASVVVSLSQPATSQVQASVRTGSGGSATPGTDYWGIAPVTVTFAPGQQTATVPVTILDDFDEEANETVVMAISDVSGALTGDINPFIILNDDSASTPQLSVQAQSFGESAGTVQLNVTLDQAPGNGNTVTADVFTSSGGSATPGSDYYGTAPQTVTFTGNQTTATVSFTILPDTALEGPETINFRVINITGAIPGPVNPATIIDDDDGTGPPTMSIAAQSVSEASGFIDLQVRLNFAPGAGQTATASFYVTSLGSTATPGTDYYGVALTPVSFTGNETVKTVRVPILQDTLSEANETIGTRLVGESGAIIGGLAPITIIDDD